MNDNNSEYETSSEYITSDDDANIRNKKDNITSNKKEITSNKKENDIQTINFDELICHQCNKKSNNTNIIIFITIILSSIFMIYKYVKI